MTQTPLIELLQAIAQPLTHPIHQSPTWEVAAENEWRVSEGESLADNMFQGCPCAARDQTVGLYLCAYLPDALTPFLQRTSK